jgi:ribosome-associated translation inhibitor RaiA
MVIQVNTDRNIDGNSNFENYVKSTIESELDRFKNITRVEVYFSDQNGEKFGTNDINCRIEARIAGLKPISVIERSFDINSSLSGSINKLKTMLNKIN